MVEETQVGDAGFRDGDVSEVVCKEDAVVSENGDAREGHSKAGSEIDNIHKKQYLGNEEQGWGWKGHPILEEK